MNASVQLCHCNQQMGTFPSGSHCTKLPPTTGAGREFRQLHQPVMDPHPGLASPTHMCPRSAQLCTRAWRVEAWVWGRTEMPTAESPAFPLVPITRHHLILLFVLLFPLPLHRMAFKDFKAHFKLLVICTLTPRLLSQEVGQTWSYTMQEGRWEKGTTAGGPRKSLRGEGVHRSRGAWV